MAGAASRMLGRREPPLSSINQSISPSICWSISRFIARSLARWLATIP